MHFLTICILLFQTSEKLPVKFIWDHLLKKWPEYFVVLAGSTVPILQPWLRDSFFLGSGNYSLLNLHYVVLLSGVYFSFELFLLQNFSVASNVVCIRSLNSFNYYCELLWNWWCLSNVQCSSLNSSLGPQEQCWVDNRELRWWLVVLVRGWSLPAPTDHWFPNLLFSVRQYLVDN